MSRYWVQFAATGDPNRDDLPAWPACDPGTDQHLELDEQIIGWERALQGSY